MSIAEIIRRVESGEAVHIEGDKSILEFIDWASNDEVHRPGWRIQIDTEGRCIWVLKEAP